MMMIVKVRKEQGGKKDFCFVAAAAKATATAATKRKETSTSGGRATDAGASTSNGGKTPARRELEGASTGTVMVRKQRVWPAEA